MPGPHRLLWLQDCSEISASEQHEVLCTKTGLVSIEVGPAVEHCLSDKNVPLMPDLPFSVSQQVSVMMSTASKQVWTAADSPIRVSVPGSGWSWLGEERANAPCRSFSSGMEAGRCWSRGRGGARLSTAICESLGSLPLFLLLLGASEKPIFDFLRPLAGALAVRRSR